MAKVIFTFEEKGLEKVIVEDAQKGESVLDIAEDYDVHLNHNCGAVCACSTCHVYITSGEDYLKEISDREEDFIDRATNPTLESRLGCQCILLDDNVTIEVIIPDQSRIIGHEH